jgi:branched-chain amino acid aminotransferase
MSLACLDGVVLDASEARISVTDEGLLRGDGVFEVVRVYAGRPFAVDEHLARMTRPAEGLRLPLDADAVRADLVALLEAAGEVEGIVRLLVTRGGRRIALVEDLRPLPPTIAVASVTYAPPRLLDGIKSLSYGANMLCSRLARERGFDEALLVTPHGRVLEGATSSFFWVRDGELRTPPLEDRIFGSITRAKLIEVAGAVEEPTTLDTLQGAQEAFLASSVREVQPVATIDDLRLQATPGPVTLHAHERLREVIEREL